MPVAASAAPGSSRPAAEVSAWIDGRPAGAEDLRVLALSNYGHFTSAQVRSGAVRGWDLHLQRLAAASLELFGVETDPGQVGAAVRAALAACGAADASMRITVFARDFELRWPERACDLRLLVSLSPPRDVVPEPVRVATRRFARSRPHLKHAGLCPSLALAREARRAGFDDVLFVDDADGVSEGSVWNIGFWDGDAVVWPRADALRGTTEQLLQSGLERHGVPQRRVRVGLPGLAGFRAAFAANAAGVRGIHAIDAVQYDAAEVAALSLRLHAIFCEHVPQSI